MCRQCTPYRDGLRQATLGAEAHEQQEPAPTT